jgi:YbbR domain-containing protein
VNLITEDWRLKLLALGLAVLMLGAVAFSQNPPTQKVLRDVPIRYTMPKDLIVINPPRKTNVTVSGLADALATVNSGNIVAAFDLTNASPGPNVHVSLVVRSTVRDINIQNPVGPYVLEIDKRDQVNLPVEVRVPRISTGWQVLTKEAKCPPSSPPCSVFFDGPASWETNLTAYSDFPESVAFDSRTIPNIQVQLVQNGRPLDVSRDTEPLVKFEPSTVSIRIDAKPGTTIRQVVLVDAPPTHGPAPGYRVTDITVDPVVVVVGGTPDALARIQRITLPPVDLSGLTSSKTFQLTITYPNGIDGGAVTTARVTYTIAPNPNAST